MRGKQLKNRFLILSILLPLLGYAQQNQGDCEGAIVVCGDTAVDVIDDTGNVLDFNDPDNSLGCHLTGEASSTWLYFRFSSTMPADQILEFIISPYEGGEVDYDFALYAADTPCDALGEPVRCSYSWAFSNPPTFTCGFCPLTGLGMGETDLNEDPFGNGFVAPITVQPGQGFYLYINEFYDAGMGSMSDGFDISFGGSAADYFDCGVNPNCDQVEVDAGDDATVCSGDIPYQLIGNATYTTGFETYTWTGTEGEESFLDDPNIAQPTVTFPPAFEDTITYILEVASGDCIILDTLTLIVLPTPIFTLPADTAFCVGDSILIDAGSGFDSYQWSNDSTGSTVTIYTGGMYYVTVSGAGGGCSIVDSILVDEIPIPSPNISGPTGICPGDTIVLDGGPGYTSYFWNGNPGGQTLTVTAAGTYTLEVFDGTGCSGQASVMIEAYTAPSVSISGPVGLCPDEEGTLDAGAGFSSYLWSNDSTSQTIDISLPGTYSVTVSNMQGCVDDASITVNAFSEPDPEILGDSILCFGESGLLNPSLPYDSYLWSTTSMEPAILIDTGGTYFLTVTNAEGCLGTDSINIIYNDSLILDIDVLQNETLCSGDTVFLRATSGFDTYLWSTGAVGPISPATASGVYYVTVTDEVGCSAIDSISITEQPLPSPQINGPAGLCPQDTASLEAGNFPTVLWQSGIDTLQLTIDAPGTYTVTVTDFNGCSAADTLNVLAYVEPVPAIVGNDTLCEGSSNLLTLDQPYAAYQWSTTDPAPAILVNAAGQYSVTVTNAQGCMAADTVNITSISGPALDLPMSVTYCQGDSLEIGPASDDYASYSWNTSDTSQLITVNTPGQYNLIVTDENGCEASDVVEVIENVLPVSGLDDDYGFCTGSDVTIYAVSGMSEYQWSVPSDADSLLVNTAGEYYLTITDVNGCTGIDTFQVVENALPQITIDGDASLCSGDTSVLTPGPGFAEYVWQDGSMEATFEATQAGNYAVTVTDLNGCTAEEELMVDELPLPVLQMDTLQAFCTNDSITLNADAGYVAYLWSNSSNMASTTVNSGGLYSVTVTDDNGCEGNAEIEVIENPLPTPALQGELYFCFEDSTTLAIVDDAISEITWPDGSNSTQETFTQAGMYEVEVVDTNGCMNLLDFQIDEQPAILPLINGTDSICEGTSTTLNTDSGFDQYLWSTGSNSNSTIADTAGTYAVTVTDGLGCTGTATFGLTLQPLPDPMLSDSAYLCEDGISTLSATGGFDNYVWSTTESTVSIEVDQSGTYSVTVTDGLGCTQADTIEVIDIDVPAPLIMGDLSICPGDTNSLAVEEVYETYSWSTNDTSSTIDISEAGFYQVSVTSAGGCIATSNIFVVNADSVEVAIQGATNLCMGDTVFLTSGNYHSYEWSGGEGSSSIEVTQSGSYSLTVTNIQGCSASDTVDILLYSLPDPGLPDSVRLCENETLTIDGIGGFVNYEWQDGSQQDSFVVSQQGTYTLEVEDMNGCIGIDTTQAVVQLSPMPTIIGADRFCPEDSLALTLSGTWPDIQWSNGDTLPATLITEAGPYSVTVADEYGCAGTATLMVDTFLVAMPNIQGPAGLCPEATVLLEGEAGYANYQWNTGDNTSQLTVDSAGIYELTVEDNNGCISTAMWEVVAFPAPDVAIIGADSICNGEVTALASSGVFSMYEWSNSLQSSSIQVDSGGAYSLTVTDDNQCTASDTIELTVLELPTPEITGEAAICEGTSAELSLTESYAEISWEDGSQGMSILADTAGIYSVMVADEFGCTASTTYEVSVLPVSQPQILGPSSFCEGNTITLESDMMYDSIWWNTSENSPAISVSTDGLYILNVSNQFGCVGSDTTMVNSLSLPSVSILGDTNFCEGDTTMLEASTDGNIVSWSTGSTDPMITVATPGTISLTVSAANGCLDTATIEVNVDVLPLANAGDDKTLDCNQPDVLIGPEGQPTPEMTYEWEGPGINAGNRFDFRPLVSVPGLYTLKTMSQETGCEAAPDTVQVEDLSYEPAIVFNEPDTLDCSTPTVTIDGTGSTNGAHITYQWLGPNNNPISGANSIALTIDEAGSYTLQLVDTLTGCQAEEMQMVSSNYNFPTVSIDPPASFTCQVSTVNLTATASAPSGMLGLQWLDEDQNPISGATTLNLDVQSAEWYYLTATDLQSGCQRIDSVEVLENTDLPVADAGDDQEIDCTDNSTLLDGSASSQGGEFSFEWSNSEGPLEFSTLNPEVQQAGIYYLTISNVLTGCQNIDSVLVTPDEDALQSIEVGVVQPKCYGEENGLILVQGVTGGTPPLMYSLNGAPFTDQSVFSNLGAGNYELIAEDIMGCQVEFSTLIEEGDSVVVVLGEDREIELGDRVDLHAQTNVFEEAIEQVIWAPADSTGCIDCLSYTAQPTQSSLYSVTVVDTNGCQGSDQLLIFVNRERNVYIPNAFSPNGDGANDLFMVFAGEDVAIIHNLKVFNRWGGLLFERSNFPPNDPRFGWDGWFGGKKLNPAVLVYAVEIEFVDGEVEVFKGDVSLVR